MQQYFSYIVAVSIIGGGNPEYLEKTTTCRKSLANINTQCYIEYTSPWAGIKLTTLVVLGTDCIGSCKSNYMNHTITTTATLTVDWRWWFLTNTKKIIVSSIQSDLSLVNHLILWDFFWIFLIFFFIDYQYLSKLFKYSCPCL